MERHGGGNDGEMMSSGNKGGGLFVWSILALQLCGVCVGFGRIWQLVSVCVSFLFAFSCVQDRR